ncbi:MAG: general secretion pathway protein GspB [Gammaproteobacteria bacterium]
MSYILDALKKAERERELGQIPNRRSLLYEMPSRRRWRLGMIMLTVLLLNAGLLTYGIMVWRQPEPVPVAIKPMAPATRPDLAQNLTEAAPAVVPVTALTVTPEPVPALEPEAARVVVAEQPLTVGEPQPYRRLAQPLRDQLGPLNLDLHVYGDSPERRFVLINSRRYQTGDWLHEGPLLEAITADGVILSFQGQRFSLSAQL